MSSKEQEFFYEFDKGFRNNVDIKLACEQSSKRDLALQKLYFDYKNNATFKKNVKLNTMLSQKPVSETKMPKQYQKSSLSVSTLM